MKVIGTQKKLTDMVLLHQENARKRTLQTSNRMGAARMENRRKAQKIIDRRNQEDYKQCNLQPMPVQRGMEETETDAVIRFTGDNEMGRLLEQKRRGTCKKSGEKELRRLQLSKV